MNKFIKINDNDNVIITLTDLKEGNLISGIKVLEDILAGHKIALNDINKGSNIIKYGLPIGSATSDIKQGQWVHTHNVKTNLSDLIEYKYDPKFVNFDVSLKGRDINVYHRANGDIGIRNEIWIVPTVGCVNSIATKIIEQFKKEVDPSECDGIFTFAHSYGCSQLGEDHNNTKIALQNIAKHPNAGGVLVLGLGCENNQVKVFKETMGDYNEERVRFLISQEYDDEISAGVEMLKELYEICRHDKRQLTPISKLKVGLECGGSDGFSGITANPLLGKFSDYLIKHSGTSVLTEVPEMFGAETILMERAINKEVFTKVVDLINDFKTYFKKNDQEIYENPSPGNKKGGITTLEDKSLGCTQKAGDSCVLDVLKYGETIKTSGLNLLSSPGNDLVATTALGMSGCHLVLFTTGRGTPYGGFVPTIKISTNTDLYKRKPNWIDFNAGALVDNKTMDELLVDFIDYVVNVCNGEKTNNEKNNFREIAIFKSGVTL